MKKKILLVIVALFIGFVSLSEVRADHECVYETPSGIIKVKFFNKNSQVKLYYVHKSNDSKKEVSYPKFGYTGLSINENCPDSVNFIYDESWNGIDLLKGNFEFFDETKALFSDYTNLGKISACRYINEIKYTGSYTGNTTTHQTVITVPIIDADELTDGEYRKTQILIDGKEVYVLTDFNHNKCSDAIRITIFGWREDSTLINSGTAPVMMITEDIENEIKGVTCGSGEGKVTDIPKKIPELTSMMFTIVQVAVPIILVIMGSIDLFKGITAGKEDEMKKGQQMFIKRLAIGAIIFLVVIIVKFIISIVADTGVANMVDCIDCFISNNCGEW